MMPFLNISLGSTRFRIYSIINLSTLFLLLSLIPASLHAQVVQVGAGSYSTTLPSGEIGPQNASGQNILPKVSNSFDQKVQTNDWWSSLIFPFFGNQHSGKLIAHPLSMQANKSGLELSYQPKHVLINAAPGSDYLFPYVAQMTVGIQGLNSQIQKHTDMMIGRLLLSG